MATSLTESTSSHNSRPPLPPRLRLSAGIVAVTVFGVFAVGVFVSPYLSDLLARKASPVASTEDTDTPRTATADAAPSLVTLSAEKLSATKIQLEPATTQTLTHEHVIPGRIEYNDNRHVEVTAPTGGILTQVLVKPGDPVARGQVLAWLNSPEIGAARADVLQRAAEAAMTATLADRARSLEQNIVALTKTLENEPTFDAVTKQFRDRVLGDYRSSVFAAYSEMLLAESLVKGSAGLAQSGALSGKVVQERLATAQAARAELQSLCEQATLDVWQERSKAETIANDARRRLEIARQHLASLLLDAAATQTDADMPDVAQLGASDDDLQHLSRVAVRAPFAGTIESRAFSASERVHATDSLFVLADTSTLWVTAEIRENDWAAVSLETGHTLTITVPALGNATFNANVEYIGREVSLETNAIPIVAVIDNTDGVLRPGLFVRVAVPVGTKGDTLTVPTRAILRDGVQSFVFVAESDNQFRRIDVDTGTDSDERTEIVSGLATGDQIVTHGAFLLKSELLLEGEEE